MSAQQSAGTKPEARLEGALRSKGLVFVQQRRPEPDLRCRLDFVFEEEKVAVDVRGCFWHACPIHGSFPRSNAERWAEKLKGNVDRDERNLRDLRSRGWLVRIVWEHEDPMNAAQKIARCVRRRQRQSGARATP